MPESKVSRWEELQGEEESDKVARWQEPKRIPLPALAGEAFLDSLLAIPSGSGDLLAAGAGTLEGLAHGFVPGGEGFEFQRRIGEQQDVGIAHLLRQIPRPTTAELASGVRALPDLASGGDAFYESYGEELADVDAQRMATEEEFPTLGPAAPLVGEGLAIATGRLPFLNRLSRMEDALMTINKPDLFFRVNQLDQAPVTVRNAISTAIRESKGLRRLLRGTGRSVEAGIEATILDIINGGDPGETFGLAAGLQLANSGLLQGGKSVFGGSVQAKLTKLTATLIVGAAAWQQLQLATPLEDNFLDALNVSGEKILIALSLGAVAGLAGGGRFRGDTTQVSKSAQSLMDAFTSVPRNSMTGILREMSEADPKGREAMGMLMQGVLMNPLALTKGEQARIDAALDNGTFAKTATVMMRDNRLVERLFEEPEAEEYAVDPTAFSGIPFEK